MGMMVWMSVILIDLYIYLNVWSLVGGIVWKECGFVGGGILLGVGFEVSKTPIVRFRRR